MDEPVHDDDQPAREPLHPLSCTRCGRVLERPTLKVFHSVASYVSNASKKTHQGVFCATCEMKEALRCSGITLVAGWWSLQGVPASVQALFRNFIGGRFYYDNARLQAHQAYYFAEQGRADLAKAVANSAMQQADHVAMKNATAEQVAQMPNLKAALEALTNSLADVQPARLPSGNQYLNARFASQALMLYFASMFALGLIVAVLPEDPELQRQLARERQGAAVAQRQQREALKKLEQPLPLTGVMGKGHYSSDYNPPLKVTNGPESHVLLKLESKGVEVLTAFIRRGEILYAAVPPGTYVAKLASGSKWYGDKLRFGAETTYSKFDQPLTFTVKGTQLLGSDVTLTQVRNGNLKQAAIRSADF